MKLVLPLLALASVAFANPPRVVDLGVRYINIPQHQYAAYVASYLRSRYGIIVYPEGYYRGVYARGPYSTGSTIYNYRRTGIRVPYSTTYLPSTGPTIGGGPLDTDPVGVSPVGPVGIAPQVPGDPGMPGRGGDPFDPFRDQPNGLGPLDGVGPDPSDGMNGIGPVGVSPVGPVGIAPQVPGDPGMPGRGGDPFDPFRDQPNGLGPLDGVGPDPSDGMNGIGPVGVSPVGPVGIAPQVPGDPGMPGGGGDPFDPFRDQPNGLGPLDGVGPDPSNGMNGIGTDPLDGVGPDTVPGAQSELVTGGRSFVGPYSTGISGTAGAGLYGPGYIGSGGYNIYDTGFGAGSSGGLITAGSPGYFTQGSSSSPYYSTSYRRSVGYPIDYTGTGSTYSLTQYGGPYSTYRFGPGSGTTYSSWRYSTGPYQYTRYPRRTI